jgi:hemerythrin
MDSFVWDDQFKTGIDIVDEQHHFLVDLINQIGEQLTNAKPTVHDLEKMFIKVKDYTQYHFDDEEKMMRHMQLDKRHTDHHFKLHEIFLTQVSELQNRVTVDTADQLLKLLINWLAYHILGIDKDMSKQVTAIKSGMSPADAYDTEERKKSESIEPILLALNNLFEQVTERNHQLIELNNSLEKKVDERTLELTQANEKLEKMVITDVLTNLPNRRFAMDQLTQLWSISNTSQPLVCMMIDADHFKEVNDTYGHDAGDTVLIELSSTLKASVRNSDIVCRLGGDEFLIICPDTDLHKGLSIAQQIHSAVSLLKVPCGTGEWKGSISIGIAERTDSMHEFEEMMKLADNAVYAAKEAGKNQIKSVQ